MSAAISVSVDGAPPASVVADGARNAAETTVRLTDATSSLRRSARAPVRVLFCASGRYRASRRFRRGFFFSFLRVLDCRQLRGLGAFDR